MMTPVSFPAQQMVSPAQGNMPPHRETAFEFNFNAPAISHDEPGGANNGQIANFGPATDVFQKKNDVPAAALNQPQFSAPAFGPQTSASPETLNSPYEATAQTPPSMQPTFGNAMAEPMPGSPGMPPISMPFVKSDRLPSNSPSQLPGTMPGQLPNPSMPFAAPPPYAPAFPPPPPYAQATQQTPANPGLPLNAALPQQPPPSYSQAIQQPPAYPGLPQPQPPAEQAAPPPYSQTEQTPPPPYSEMENQNKTPISDLNTMIAQPRTPDEKLAAINEIATRQQGDRQTYELLKQEISTPMQGIPPETASAIRQAALIALGSLNGNPINAKLPGNQLYGMEGISRILNDKNENPLIKASAVAALGYMNRPQDKTIQKLLKKAAKDTNPDVKNAVAQVQLGQMNAPSASGTKA